ncbi:MAG: alpha/beta hydrolase [Acidobacteriota bacterium]|nr:alpha/beta hydrolase [Acidobacteriota bacterium]
MVEGSGLHCEVRPGGSTAVVLLHGQPGTSEDWQWVTPLLDERYTLILPDRPGYGRSTEAATGFAGNAAAVVELLDRLEVGKVLVVGYSWAGGAALALAADHPDRVSGLVLVSSVGPDEPTTWADRLLAQPLIGEAAAALTIGGPGWLLRRPRVQNLATRRLRGRPMDAVTALVRLSRDGTRMWRSFAVEQRALIGELPGLAPGLGAIRVPTAVVHGRADHVVPPGVAEHLARSIPGATLELVARVGHLLPHDRPEEVAAAIEAVAARAGRD